MIRTMGAACWSAVCRFVALAFVPLAAAAMLFLTSCGSEGDNSEGDGAAVGEIVGSAGSGSVSGAGAVQGSGATPADGGSVSTPGDADGGYEYASDVGPLRLVAAGVCGIGEMLKAGDFASAEDVYRTGGTGRTGGDGGDSAGSAGSAGRDGPTRSVGDFATDVDATPMLNFYYGTRTPLDDFITSALKGTGMFEGRSDAVKSQAAENGIRHQAVIAWAIGELTSALLKSEYGNFGVADGGDGGGVVGAADDAVVSDIVRSWDSFWALFHGAEPDCAPYATGDELAAEFGTVGSDGRTALANETILAAVIDGRDALLAQNLAGAEAAADAVIKGLVVIYSQAVIRHAHMIKNDLADGNDARAEEHQAGGLALWRVIEAYAARAEADIDAVNAVFKLGSPPGANDYSDKVRVALAPMWDVAGIEESDIGTFQ